MTDTTITPVTADINTITTPQTGKTIADFQVPEKFFAEQQDLIAMLLRSESMNDEERQYWFNLAEVMNAEQISKLRGILNRECDKLAEIEKKYGPKQPTLTTAEITERNTEIQAKRSKRQADIAAREAANEATEDDESILSELDNL